MTNLSPPAQVIWDAFSDGLLRIGVLEDYGDALAAVLRAAADQVVPNESHPKEPMLPSIGVVGWWGSTDDEAVLEWETNHNVRLQLLAIANELEVQSTPSTIHNL